MILISCTRGNIKEGQQALLREVTTILTRKTCREQNMSVHIGADSYRWTIDMDKKNPGLIS